MLTLGGKVLALEGIDGSGKSTIANFLREELHNSGLEIHVEAEPTDFIRDIVARGGVNGFSSFLLFSADRYLHQEKIAELRKQGAFTILDRYVLSSYAYQGEDIRKELGDFSSALEWMENVSSKLHVMPDITIILDGRPEKCLERAKKRGEINPVFERPSFLEKVRENYLYLGKIFPNTMVVNSEMPIKEVLNRCIEIIKKRFDL